MKKIRKKTGPKRPSDKWEIEPMEIPHNTVNKENQQKSQFDFYKDIFTWREMPVTDKWLEAMCKDMVSSAYHDPDFLTITQFYHKRGFSSEDMARWMERNPLVKKAHDLTLTILGDKREIGAIKNKMNAGTVMYTMPLFKKSWKDLAEWRSQLNKEKEAPARTVVVIEKFPESNNEQS